MYAIWSLVMHERHLTVCHKGAFQGNPVAVELGSNLEPIFEIK